MAFVGEEQQQSSNFSSNTQTRPAEVYKFSTEELRVLKQCNIESFYQRCLPLGSFLGLSTYYAIKSGYLRGHPRFGAVPKTCVAVIAGYFLGKLSYQQKCAEKIMALPESKLAEMLRQRRRKGFTENISLDPGFSAPIGLESVSGFPAGEVPPRQSSLNMDVDQPILDFYKPSPQAESYDVSAIPVPPGGVPSTSYDELRKKNREEYDSQRNRPYSYRPLSDLPETETIKQRPSNEPTRPRTKNKYGDDWEQ